MSRRFIHAFNVFTLRRPFLAPVITTFTLFGAGDVLAQQGVERKGKDHDFLRTARLASYGGFIFAPIASKCLRLLEHLPVRSKPALIASRVALDQFVFSPIIVGVFFTCTTLMEGKTLKDAEMKLETTYKRTLVANWKLFIPFQMLNLLVPMHHRLLAVNVVSLFWNAYLSLMASSSHISAAKPEALA
ncbi:uncharacterized protein EI90DRAFT_2968719 [Cantharellus anzutake]|uniref:uncharacterized protein n=1 Tax=Cantharellus anzutake TaxID=1750568 RepID=UPI00190693D4|nr:uncharacterized protein EI90DRAFT_2968719 [Cantharellus anzutake]KAF8336994.1 hypothetical protein EI90DRAFT_2968719 [Cantharellus anzutake]